MEFKEHRRKSKRYAVRWKAAVVFDRTTGRPILHTETYDLSLGGGAISTEYGDLTGSMVTLLLAQPPRQAGEQPRMLKVPARVVSSRQTPGKSGYRHGLSFIRAPNDGLDGLEELLKAATSASEVEMSSPSIAPTPAAAAAAPAAAPAAPPTGRLAALKAAALAKAEADAKAAKVDPQKEKEQRIHAALQRAYAYLKEMSEQLDVVKPQYPSRGYAIPGVPEFSEFAWEAGYVNLRTRELSLTEKIFTSVQLDFRLSNSKPMIKVQREFPASDKFRQVLKEIGLKAQTSDSRNERGVVTSFSFPCEVLARVEFDGNFETGKLLLKMRNVERFGAMEYVVAPEAVTQESLEELTGFILGETAKVGPLILQNA